MKARGWESGVRIGRIGSLGGCGDRAGVGSIKAARVPVEALGSGTLVLVAQAKIQR